VHLAGQRGNLGHLQKEPGHRETHLDQPEQAYRSGHFLPDRLTPFRRCPERGYHRVPDQPSALPQDPLHAVILGPSHLS